MKWIFLLFVPLLAALAVLAQPQAQLLVVTREYPSGRPLGGVAMNLTLRIDGREHSFNARMNPAGVWVAQLKGRPGVAYLTALSVAPANFTGYATPLPSVPVRVVDTMIEDVEYAATYVARLNVTRVTGLNVPLSVVTEGNLTVVKCSIWLAPGRVVNVSVFDPVTRRPAKVTVKPGVPLRPRDYLQPYLVPVGYPVLVVAHTPLARARQLRYWVTNATSLIPWSYHAASVFLEDRLGEIEDLLRQLEAIDYPIGEFKRDATALRALARQALFFFERGNYTSAIGVLLTLASGVEALRSRVSGLFGLSHVIALGAILLTLAFSHTLSMLLVERGRTLTALRLSLLVALLLVTILTSPAMRLATASLFGALGIPLASLDILTLAAGILAMGFLAYSIFMLISLAAGPVRGLWLHLAIRYMKSRRTRTVLVLITMTLVLTSTLAVSGVALETASLVKTGRGAGFYGLDIELNTVRRPYGFNATEIEWLTSVLNAHEVGRMAVIPPFFIGAFVSKQGEEVMTLVQIVALDVRFAVKHFNLTAAIYEGRPPRDGSAEVLLPKGLLGTYRVGDSVWLFFAKVDMGRPAPAGPIWDAPVKVVGFFDPLILNSTLDPELRPLFGDFARVQSLVIVPVDPLSKRLAISRVWLLTRDLTAARHTAELVFSTLPTTVHVLEGKRVTTYESVMQISFRGLEVIILLAIAALMNFIVMLGHVESRHRDAYTIATLGADPKNLFTSLIVEATILGLIASYIGWLAAPLINLALSWLSTLWGGVPIAASPLPIESLFYAVAVGLAVSVASAYVPSRRMSGLSRMGREERKVISPSEMRIVSGMAVYELPIRVSVFESEALYRYLKTILPKKDLLGEEVYLDGTFAISFAMMPPYMKGALVTCRLRSVRRGDVLALTLEMPEEYRRYVHMSETVYALETRLLGYSKWRESQFKYQILRMAPRREVLTLDSLLERSRGVMSKAREIELKLRRLEEMKVSISTSLYSEYEKKYRRELNVLIRELVTISLRLEPFVGQLKDEIRKLEAEMEKHRVAYELGELSDSEYKVAVEPLEEQLSEYKDRLRMIEEVSSFLASRRR